jgi:hypothetical protein
MRTTTIRHGFLLGTLCVLSALPLLADPPVLTSVEPRQVLVDEATTVEVRGSGLAPESRILLRPGGPVPLTDLPTYRWAAFSGRRVVGYTYAGVHGWGFSVFDLIDLSNPQRIGEPLPLGESGYPIGLAVHADRAYVAHGRYCDEEGDGYYKIEVVDIGQPDGPRGLGEFASGNWCSADPHAPRVIAVEGVRVFVLTRTGRLDVWDVSDPAGAQQLGSVELSDISGVRDMEASGSAVYLSRGAGGLEIIDVSDPTSPASTGLVEGLDVAHDLELALPYGYISAGVQGLRVYDLSDSLQPEPVGAAITVFQPLRLLARGALGFVECVESTCSTEPGIAVLDLGTPESPEVLQHISPLSNASLADATEELLLLSRGELLAVDSPTGPDEVVARVPASGNVHRSESSARFYLHGSSVTSVAIENPTQPEVLETVNTTNPFPYFYDLHFVGSAMLGDVTYVGYYSGDICRGCSDGGPQSLGLLYRLDFAADPMPEWVSAESSDRVVADEEKLYLGVNWVNCTFFSCFRGRWIDILDPTDPFTYLGRIPDVRSSFFASDGWLFVRGDVIDARDPSAPVEAGTLDFFPRGGKVRDSVAYLKNGSSLAVVDLLGNSGPTLVSTTPLVGWSSGSGVVLEGNRAMATTGSGVRELDISDPLRPQLVRLGSTSAHDLEPVDADHFLLSGGEIVRLNPRLGESRQVGTESVEAEVPAGFHPGPYDVLVIDEEGSFVELPNAFRACLRRDLQATLEPVLAAELPSDPRALRGLLDERPRWRVTIEGDEEFVKSRYRNDALVTLPELPGTLEVLHEPGDGSGSAAIELHLDPQLGAGVVRLIGDDEEALDALWSDAQQAGGFVPPRLDDRSFGDLQLEVMPLARRGGPGWIADAGSRRAARLLRSAPLHYRYELVDGVLDAARARGEGADVTVRALGTDLYRCEYESETSVLGLLREQCEQAAATDPRLAGRCSF